MFFRYFLFFTMSFIWSLSKGQHSDIYTVKLPAKTTISQLKASGLQVENKYNLDSTTKNFFSDFLSVRTSDESLLTSLVNSGKLLYWEKQRTQYFHFTPSDTAFSRQWYLNKINIEPVWDFTLGDTSFVVGVIDSGVDYTHEDLKKNLAYNYNDPINGIDDDLDGYVDNFYGWDFGANDNDPMVDGFDFRAHGSSICGVVAASTNNTTGIASAAANCKYLPVKITDKAGLIIDSNIGIAYAAQMGVQVINCSFGSSEFSQAEADIIAYVTDSMDVLVVASAGNTASETQVYPAALEDVIGVCAVNQSDEKTAISNYGLAYQISAPGEAIYTTFVENDYTYTSGTSVAAAILSSAAILLRSYFPDESVFQIRNRLLNSADAIAKENVMFENLLGSGRLNLSAAFDNDSTKKSVMTLFPNPSNGNFTIDFTQLNSGNYQISFFDVLGNLYHRTKFFASATESNINFSLDYLKQGYYTVQLSGNGVSANSGIVIVK